MTLASFIVTGIFLAIVQTSVMLHLPIFLRLFDLPTPFILWLGLFRPFREGLPAALVAGFVMDTFSGGPFGLYMTVYFWLTLAVRWITRYLHAGNVFLFPLVLAVAVVIEHAVFLVCAAFLQEGFHFPADGFHVVTIQVVWAILAGPIFLKAFAYLDLRRSALVRELVDRAGDPEDR